MVASERKELIFKCALKLSNDIGYYNLTQGNVSKHAKVSIALIHKYFVTIRNLQASVLRYAVHSKLYNIIAQGVMVKDPVIRNLNPDTKKEALKQLLK